MNISNSSTSKLALAVSSCSEVCKAFSDLAHPCAEVVNWQVAQWKQEIKQVEGSQLHRPEAWTGDLSKAPILFLASNPSFDKNENFPSWDSNIWSDEEVSDFGSNRFAASESRKYGATDSRLVDMQDRTIGLDSSLSGKVDHWVWVRKYVAMVLGKSLEETSAIDDYVMTELVHCKSPSEQGVLKALNTCSEKWFEKIMFESPAKLIFVAGAKAGEAFARIYSKDVPETWGSWSNSQVGKGKGFWPKSKAVLDESVVDGRWSVQNQMLNSVEIEIGGINRLAIYIARPNRGASIYAPWAHKNLIADEVLTHWRNYLGKHS